MMVSPHTIVSWHGKHPIMITTHDDIHQNHPSCLTTNEISLIALFPFFLQARWFLAEPHENPFAHFLSLRIPKNAVSQNVHIPPFLESYDTGLSYMWLASISGSWYSWLSQCSGRVCWGCWSSWGSEGVCALPWCFVQLCVALCRGPPHLPLMLLHSIVYMWCCTDGACWQLGWPPVQICIAVCSTVLSSSALYSYLQIYSTVQIFCHIQSCTDTYPYTPLHSRWFECNLLQHVYCVYCVYCVQCVLCVLCTVCTVCTVCTLYSVYSV